MNYRDYSVSQWASMISIPIGIVVLYKLFRKWVAGNSNKHILNLKGKVVIVTGGNTGIGKETARELSKMGARVIIACRTPLTAQKAAEEIEKSSNNKVDVMHLDLADFGSIRQFVTQFKDRGLPCHILINNAGVMMVPFGFTKDGYETHFGTNHLGHFLLTNLMLPILKQNNARIVNVSALAHNLITALDFDAIGSPKGYQRFLAYARSKVGNILFTSELQRRLDAEGANVKVCSLHPGVIETEIARSVPIINVLMNLRVSYLWLKTPLEGAQTSLHCALAPDIKGGAYYDNCKIAQPSPLASDPALAKKLWDISEKWVGLK